MTETFFARRQEGVKPQTLYTTHPEALKQLFVITGKPLAALATIEETVAVTQPWVAGDHSRPNPANVMRFDEASSQRLHGIYDELGIKRFQSLPEGDYDQVLVMGAILRGTNRRLDFLKQQLDQGRATTERIIALGGERRVFPEKEVADIAENFDLIDRAGIEDEWVERLRARPLETWWETDMLRLAAMARLGHISLESVHSELDRVEGYPQRQEFDWRGIEVTIAHTLAVARKDGVPRPNTEATIAAWLNEGATRPRKNARIAFIAANPHMDRMLKSARHIIHRVGRHDIELVLGGPGAPEDIGHSMYFGEIGRSLYEDQRILQAVA